VSVSAPSCRSVPMLVPAGGLLAQHCELSATGSVVFDSVLVLRVVRVSDGTGLDWTGLGWAGLGWAASESSCVWWSPSADRPTALLLVESPTECVVMRQAVFAN
jgi:hypothetical protein